MIENLLPALTIMSAALVVIGLGESLTRPAQDDEAAFEQDALSPAQQVARQWAELRQPASSNA